MLHRHNMNISRNDAENEAGINRCSICNKITNHPIDEAIQVKAGSVGN